MVYAESPYGFTQVRLDSSKYTRAEMLAQIPSGPNHWTNDRVIEFVADATRKPGDMHVWPDSWSLVVCVAPDSVTFPAHDGGIPCADTREKRIRVKLLEMIP